MIYVYIERDTQEKGKRKRDMQLKGKKRERKTQYLKETDAVRERVIKSCENYCILLGIRGDRKRGKKEY